MKTLFCTIRILSFFFCASSFLQHVTVTASEQEEVVIHPNAQKKREKFLRGLQTRRHAPGTSFRNRDRKRASGRHMPSAKPAFSDIETAPETQPGRKILSPECLAQLTLTVQKTHTGNQGIPYAGKGWQSQREQQKSTEPQT